MQNLVESIQRINIKYCLQWDHNQAETKNCVNTDIYEARLHNQTSVSELKK